MTRKYLFAGFGGQGLLFSGKVLAYKGLIEDKNVSWLPSYGPEMRGGTASCGVTICLTRYLEIRTDRSSLICPI